jgi:hypothetical protein
VSMETYTRVAAVVAWAVYVICVVNLQAVFQLLTGANSQLAVVVSTLVLAVVLNPFRVWIQNLIGHRLRERQARRTARQ